MRLWPTRRIIRTGTVPHVDLMPPDAAWRRDRSRLLRGWGGAALGAVAVVAVGSLAALGVNLAASLNLTAAQAQSDSLLTTVAAMSDVNGVLRTQQDIESFRTRAMGVDVTWASVYEVLRRAVPKDARLSGWDLTVGAIPRGGDTRLADQTGMTGSVQVTASSPVDVVSAVHALRDTQSVRSADAVQVSRKGTAADVSGGSDAAGGVYTYRIDVVLDQTVYSGQYTPKDN